MRRGRTTTTTDVDARRPPLHHGCVRPAAATTHGHRRRRGAGRHPFCWGIGSELLLHALLGGAARRTAPVLACQWRVGRRAPTRRCVVRSSTGNRACRSARWTWTVDPMPWPRCAVACRARERGEGRCLSLAPPRRRRAPAWMIINYRTCGVVSQVKPC